MSKNQTKKIVNKCYIHSKIIFFSLLFLEGVFKILDNFVFEKSEWLSKSIFRKITYIGYGNKAYHWIKWKYRFLNFHDRSNYCSIQKTVVKSTCFRHPQIHLQTGCHQTKSLVSHERCKLRSLSNENKFTLQNMSKTTN